MTIAFEPVSNSSRDLRSLPANDLLPHQQQLQSSFQASASASLYSSIFSQLRIHGVGTEIDPIYFERPEPSTPPPVIESEDLDVVSEMSETTTAAPPPQPLLAARVTCSTPCPQTAPQQTHLLSLLSTPPAVVLRWIVDNAVWFRFMKQLTIQYSKAKLR